MKVFWVCPYCGHTEAARDEDAARVAWDAHVPSCGNEPEPAPAEPEPETYD